MNKAAIDNQEPRKRNRWRRWKRWTIVFAGLLFIAGAAAWGALRYYPQWNQDRLMRKAQAFMQAKDYKSAGLTTLRVLQLDSRNIDATALMTEIAEAVQSPEAIGWRRRLSDLHPGDFDHRIALAKLAVRLGDIPTARAALLEPPPAVRSSGDFQNLAGQVATAGKDMVSAEAHFSEAVRLQPENDLYRFNLASVRLLSKELEEHAGAREELENLRKKPEMRRQSLQLLVREAMARGDLSRANVLAIELKAAPDATFDDRLLHLSTLRRLRHPDFTSTLSKVQDEAAADLLRVYSVLTWMNNNGLARAAIQWAGRLPSATVTAMPIPVALADSYAKIGDWQGLKPLVDDREENQNPASPIDPFPKKSEESSPQWAGAEYMRLALLSRALHGSGQVQESQNRWNEAVRAAGARVDALKALAQAARDWKWETQLIEILWKLAEDDNEVRPALDILERHYFASGSTRNLLRVAAKRIARQPSDPFAMNNMAGLSLLLNSNLDQAIKMAEEVYRKDPANPAFASTYAYALHFQGRTSEGIEIMRSMAPGTLDQPNYAGYYGVMLAANGLNDEAGKYLALARNAHLLPEERQLVEKAAAKVGLDSPAKTPVPRQ